MRTLCNSSLFANPFRRLLSSLDRSAFDRNGTVMGSSISIIGKPLQLWCIHLLRIAMLGSILVLMHLQYARIAAETTASTTTSIDIQNIRQLFPSADRLEPRNPQGDQWVLDPSGAKIGYVVQTAPQSDAFLGFSGPSNLMIAFNRDERIVGIEILSSRDTRDHVALIRNDANFLSSWIGLNSSEAASRRNVDGVAGATLTSLAMVQGIQRKLGATRVLAKFATPLQLSDATPFFSDAVAIKPDPVIDALWHVLGDDGQPLGSLLRTSPAADSVVGYQGPTEVRLAWNNAGETLGVAIGGSFDNEPYVGYVRSDTGFLELLSKFTAQQWSELDLKEQGIEGVSGATMTSMAVAESLVAAAKKWRMEQASTNASTQATGQPAVRHLGTIVIVGVGMVIGLTRLRGNSRLRSVYQLALIVYLGLINGDLLSMAMWVGWAHSGIPWQNAVGLVVLSIAALAIPIGAKTNVYCSHLCPHGAVQQLLPRRWKRRAPLGEKTRWLLSAIQPLLLIWVLLVGILCLPLSLVDIEPFDAYAWRAAAWPTLIVCALGLIASFRIPMAYCRFGCPTGAVLSYIRRNAKSHQWSYADSFVAICLLLSLSLYAWTAWK
jgi:Na+-translocating ferredoxin:NAD+ oxidoreductase RnfG subunit